MTSPLLSPLSKDAFIQTLRLEEITLLVADLSRALDFYVNALGLIEIQRDPGQVSLSATGEAPALLRLRESPGAPARPRGTTGLFHLALLLPSRPELALVIHRLLKRGISFEGAADHGVSEALYLRDPEGNGLELYADREPSLWPRKAAYVDMYTEALDVPGLLLEAKPEKRARLLPPETRIGHLHLSVANLSTAERLFHLNLGMAVTQRDLPGALFMAHDGYHHHLATNTWQGTRLPPAGSLGLQSFVFRYGSESLLAKHSGSLRNASPFAAELGYAIQASATALTFTSHHP